MADKKAAAKKEKSNMLGTKEVAAKLKITAARFRRILRMNKKNKPGEYTRYAWDPKDDLKKEKAMVEAAEAQAAADKKAKPAKKAAKKSAPKKAAKKTKADKKDEADDIEAESGDEGEELE